MREQSIALANARRDIIVLSILIAAVFLLIWNGTELFHRLSFAKSDVGANLRVTLIALTLNVALILFGWRRYVDLQHESEMRQEGEARAALLASTDGMTAL
ncbi:MAG: GGDEF-domain containing protein, partial [Sphingomonas sp.]|nr:GGDEF-domain containing protein [Sphingomonas sp.]